MASVRRTATLLAATAATAATAALGVLAAPPAAAHGSMQNPLSRIQGCYLEGPEHPRSAACRAAIDAGGTQGAYDWMGVRIGDANGRHRELIPDGELCSAGDPEFAGFDLPRADWPATALTPGAPYTFRFRATAAHRGTFRLYLTRAGYDPTRPLRWSDLSDTPFLTATDPQPVDGQYVLPGTVPGGPTGRHLLYAIWQRSDSPEAFYSCSDVQLGPATATTATTTVAGSVPASVTASGAPAATVGTPTATALSPAPAVPSGPAAPQLARTGGATANGVLLSLGSVLLLTGAAFALPHRRRPRHAR